MADFFAIFARAGLRLVEVVAMLSLLLSQANRLQVERITADSTVQGCALWRELMADYFEPMLELTRNLVTLVTASAADHERDQRLAATAIEVPQLVFSHLQHGLANNRERWAEAGDATFFEPLSGEMRFNGILIKEASVR